MQWSKWKHDNPKPFLGFSKSSTKGKVHTNKSLPQETKENQINSLTSHLKQLEKEEIKNPRVSRRIEMIKISAEINGEKVATILFSKSTTGLECIRQRKGKGSALAYCHLQIPSSSDQSEWDPRLCWPASFLKWIWCC